MRNSKIRFELGHLKLVDNGSLRAFLAPGHTTD